MYVCVCSVAQSCLTLWGPTECKLPGPLFMEFSRQEYWSGLLFPTPGDLPEQEIEAESPALADGFFTTSATWEPLYDSAILLLDNFTQEKWKHAHTNTCTQIFHTCIPNSQTQKQSNKGTLHGNKKKKGTTNACNTKDASQLCKWEKPDAEGYILYDFMSMDLWKWHNCWHRNASVVARV